VNVIDLTTGEVTIKRGVISVVCTGAIDSETHVRFPLRPAGVIRSRYSKTNYITFGNHAGKATMQIKCHGSQADEIMEHLDLGGVS
jgi:hypothetical protein